MRIIAPPLLVALLASGCAATPERRTAVRDPVVQGPHVASHTRAIVELVAPLDLSSSASGAVLDGSFVDDLRSPSGDIVVRAGARVHGRVEWRTRTGRMVLREATADTPVGPLELHAALETNDSDDGVAPSAPSLSPGSAMAHATPGAQPAVPVRPIGARVTLTLTRPLMAPGAFVFGS